MQPAIGQFENYDDVEEMKTRIMFLEDRVDELEEVIGLKSQFRFPVERIGDVTTSNVRDRLLGMLISLTVVSSQSAYIALYGERKRQPSRSVLSVHMTGVRKLLLLLGIELRTIHGFGWMLSAEDRQKLRKMQA